MKLLILAMLVAGCSFDNTPVKVRIVSYSPFHENGHGWSYTAEYEYWTLEDVTTHQRYTVNTNYGKIENVFILPKSQLRRF